MKRHHDVGILEIFSVERRDYVRRVPGKDWLTTKMDTVHVCLPGIYPFISLYKLSLLKHMSM